MLCLDVVIAAVTGRVICIPFYLSEGQALYRHVKVGKPREQSPPEDIEHAYMAATHSTKYHIT